MSIRHLLLLNPNLSAKELNDATKRANEATERVMARLSEAAREMKAPPEIKMKFIAEQMVMLARIGLL